MKLTRKDFLRLSAATGLGAISGASAGRGAETMVGGGEVGNAKPAISGRPNVLVMPSPAAGRTCW